MPIFNVDGVAYIEKKWNEEHKIVPQRKNMHGACGKESRSESEKNGVDLNRNFGIDFGQIDDIVNYQGDGWKTDSWAAEGNGHTDKRQSLAQDHCQINYPGEGAFSEPETQAFKSFLTKEK